MQTIAIYLGIIGGFIAGVIAGHNGFSTPWQQIAVLGMIITLFGAMILHGPLKRKRTRH